MNRLLDELDSDGFVMCLDIGHVAITGTEPEDYIRGMSNKRLKALHVHDTDGLRDRHWLMGDGVIDWVDFGNALSEIGFEGCFSIESVVKANSPEDRKAQLTRLHTTAKKIIGA